MLWAWPYSAFRPLRVSSAHQDFYFSSFSAFGPWQHLHVGSHDTIIIKSVRVSSSSILQQSPTRNPTGLAELRRTAGLATLNQNLGLPVAHHWQAPAMMWVGWRWGSDADRTQFFSAVHWIISRCLEKPSAL